MQPECFVTLNNTPFPSSWHFGIGSNLEPGFGFPNLRDFEESLLSTMSLSYFQLVVCILTSLTIMNLATFPVWKQSLIQTRIECMELGHVAVESDQDFLTQFMYLFLYFIESYILWQLYGLDGQTVMLTVVLAGQSPAVFGKAAAIPLFVMSTHPN